jgi:hypothetical protein
MMAERQQYPESDPRHHAIKIQGMLNDVIQHAREDVGKVHGSGCQALYEITRDPLRPIARASGVCEL